MFKSVSQKTDLLKEGKIITFKSTQELLRCNLGQLPLLLGSCESFLSLLLVCDSLNLSVSSPALALKSLGHHQHRFSVSFVLCLVSLKRILLVLENQFTSCILKRLPDENLKHGFNFSFKVIKFIIGVIQLKADRGSLWVWYESRWWLNSLRIDM